MNKIAFLETMINTLKFDSKFIDKKEKLLKKICKDGDTNRKGRTQLLYTINKLINEKSL